MNEQQTIKDVLGIFYQILKQFDEVLDSEVGTSAIMRWQFEAIEARFDELGIRYESYKE